MIEAKIVKNHQAPVVALKFSSNVPGNIVVDLGEVLAQTSAYVSHSWRYGPRECETYRDEEARRAIMAVKGVREQLQPGIIAVHEELPHALGFDLSQPRVLSSKCRRGVCLVEIQDQINK